MGRIVRVFLWSFHTDLSHQIQMLKLMALWFWFLYVLIYIERYFEKNIPDSVISYPLALFLEKNMNCMCKALPHHVPAWTKL